MYPYQVPEHVKSFQNAMVTFLAACAREGIEVTAVRLKKGHASNLGLPSTSGFAGPRGVVTLEESD